MSRSSHRLLATALFTIGPLAGAAFGQGLVAPPTPTVTVSSETASTSQYGIKAIDGVVDGWPGDYTKEWATFGQLAGARIKLSWTSPVQISRVILYDRPNLTDQVLAGNLTFSDGSSVSVGTLPNAAQGLLVSFAAKTVTWLQFTVTKAQGQNIGLAEIQFYGPSSQTPSGVIASSLTLTPSTVVGGNSAQGVVNLSGAAPSGGAAVLLSSSNPSIASVPISVLVPAGQTSASFTVNTTSVGQSTSATISAAYGRVSQTATLSVSPQTTGTDLARSATVTDSSENVSSGQLGIKAIDGVIDGYPGDYTKEWATVGQLAGAWIQLNWSSPVQVSQIALWDRPNLTDNVKAGTLTFSDGSTVSVGQLPNNASSAYWASFPMKSISSVRFTITQAVGSNIGLAEFQVFATASAPLISGVQVSSSSTTATVTWSTNQLTTGKVDYGLSTSYGATVTDSSLAVTHSLTLGTLVCNGLYHYRITATGQSGASSSTSDATFTTGACSVAGPVVSDDFHGSTLNTDLWTFVNPLGNALLAFNRSNALLTVPQGSSHDAWVGGNNSARLMQSVTNSDFEVELRLQSAVMYGFQKQGILVAQDSTHFLRFDVEHNGSQPQLFAGSVNGSTGTTYVNSSMSSSGPPFWLRVRRTGDTWTESWSLDGTNFTVGVDFNFPLTVTQIGPFAANASAGGGNPPAFTASIDYFFNTASPVANTDGPLPFTRIVIDPNPPPTTLEKGLADIDGDGRLDAIIGFGNPPGGTGQGLAWYENPHSGKPTDPWLKHTILSSGILYEDLKPLDVNRDGAPDIIASFGNANIYWFENPRGHGGNPATDPWPMHFIGTGSGENTMELTDVDGDGKMDLVTNSAIFFQNSPTSWTSVHLNRTSNGLALLDIGSGKGAINVVGMGQSPFPFVWLENPREHGGNARTDPWITHVIGPGFDTTGTAASYAAADLNGDGRMDVVTAASEASFSAPILWWEAPLDRRNGTWIKHIIDPAYQAVHNLRAADIDGNGTRDIIAGEQEQAPYRRFTVFYSDGHGNFTQQILTNGSGHDQAVGDVTPDGDLDILNAGHGFTGALHPIELFLNRRKP